MRFEHREYVVKVWLDEGLATTDALTLTEALETVAMAKTAGYEAGINRRAPTPVEEEGG